MERGCSPPTSSAASSIRTSSTSSTAGMGASDLAMAAAVSGLPLGLGVAATIASNSAPRGAAKRKTGSASSSSAAAAVFNPVLMTAGLNMAAALSVLPNTSTSSANLPSPGGTSSTSSAANAANSAGAAGKTHFFCYHGVRCRVAPPYGLEVINTCHYRHFAKWPQSLDGLEGICSVPTTQPTTF